MVSLFGSLSSQLKPEKGVPSETTHQSIDPFGVKNKTWAFGPGGTSPFRRVDFGPNTVGSQAFLFTSRLYMMVSLFIAIVDIAVIQWKRTGPGSPRKKKEEEKKAGRVAV